MQLILADASYDHPEVDRDALLAAARELLAELSGEIEVTDSDIGEGADWPVFLVTLGGLFFLGKRINENLQAWLELAQKFANLLPTLAERFGGLRIDESGATSLAIAAILSDENGQVHSIDKLASAVVPFHDFAGRDPESLDAHPDCLFNQVYLVNESHVYVFVIKSRGTIEGRHIFEIGPHAM